MTSFDCREIADSALARNSCNKEFIGGCRCCLGDGAPVPKVPRVIDVAVAMILASYSVGVGYRMFFCF